MANNPRGYRGAPWLGTDIKTLRTMLAEGATNAEIARTLGRTISGVEGKIHGLRIAETCGEPLARGLGRYEAPETIESDEPWHLSRIAEANDGYGFPVVTEPLLGKLYALERSPPQPRWFWKAA